MSKSLELAKTFLGKEVEVVFDRPLGSKHPKHNYIYEVNYGYLPGVKAPDGGDLDAYYLGSDKPLNKASGYVLAILHRLKDDDDKLIVINRDQVLTDDEIEKMLYFQEKFFEHEIIRA